MSECKRCGQCCSVAFVGLHSIKIDDDKQEVYRWLGYHSCKPSRLQTDDGDCLMIRIPIICQHLSFKKGIAHCGIYDNRPMICKDFTCVKMRDNE